MMSGKCKLADGRNYEHPDGHSVCHRERYLAGDDFADALAIEVVAEKIIKTGEIEHGQSV